MMWLECERRKRWKRRYRDKHTVFEVSLTSDILWSLSVSAHTRTTMHGPWKKDCWKNLSRRQLFSQLELAGRVRRHMRHDNELSSYMRKLATI